MIIVKVISIKIFKCNSDLHIVELVKRVKGLQMNHT